MQLGECPLHFIHGENYRQSRGLFRSYDVVDPGELDAENAPIQKKQRIERLILRRWGNFTFDGEIREISADVAGAELGGIAAAVKVDETPDPGDVRVFG